MDDAPSSSTADFGEWGECQHVHPHLSLGGRSTLAVVVRSLSCGLGCEAPLEKCGPRQLRALLWFGVFCKLPSAEGKLVGALSNTADVCERVVCKDQYTAFAWSLNMAATGRWPVTDHTGRKLTAQDGHRYLRRGQLLHPAGYRLALAGICGDLKWWKEEFGTWPCYANAPEIDFEYEASVRPGDKYAYDPSIDSEWSHSLRMEPAFETCSPL